jgi:hypothetical protein
MQSNRTPVAAMAEAVAAFMSQFEAMLGSAEMELEEVERQLVEAINGVGRTAMRALLEQRDSGPPSGWWQAVVSAGTYMSTFGAVRVERSLYRCVRNGPTRCMVEERAGIIDGLWTPLAARRALALVSEVTPGFAEGLLASWGGMSPSRSSLDRLAKFVGSVWESQRTAFEEALRQQMEIPDAAATVAVSLDGVQVPMRNAAKRARKAAARAAGRPDKGPVGYKEAGCGAITFYDAAGTRLTTWRYGRMPEANKTTLKETLRAELEEIVRRRPDLVVVAIADGAPNNWSFLGTLDVDVEVVDYFHAVEHLARALDLGIGAVTPEREAAFRELRTVLRDDDDGARLVLEHLVARVARRRPTHHRRGVPYFRRHLERMDYAGLQAANLPLGSGVIEGTCRSLVSDRLKRTGMRWSAHGGQAILTLRALHRSGRADAAWTLLQPALRLAA